MVRIARPTSLAIWHCGRSHRRPIRNESPNRRHFASLDLKLYMPIFRIARQHRSIFAGTFLLFLLWFQIKLMGFRIASFASLVIWGCAIRIASRLPRTIWATKLQNHILQEPRLKPMEGRPDQDLSLFLLSVIQSSRSTNKIFSRDRSLNRWETFATIFHLGFIQWDQTVELLWKCELLSHVT